MGTWHLARPLAFLLLATVTLTEGLTKNFVNQSMPELRPMFVVNFDMSSVICQHSSNPTDLHMHDMSILCDGKMDCYSNPAMHDESFPYCEGHCNSTCSDRGACLFDGEKAQCYCNAGFHGPSCELQDVNECIDKPCHWMAHCQNTYGSYKCECMAGFEGDGFDCQDVNECVTGEANCPDNALCVNLPGTYMCNCSDGFMQKGIPLERCADIDECVNPALHSCAPHELCQNQVGGYICVAKCELGYKLANGTCVDVDECLEDGRCDKRATCENIPGSFKCQCDEGFTGDGRSCIPLTDCSQDDSICDRHAFCIGAFRTCLCQAGYKGDGLTCEDENECDAKNNPCENQHGKRCVNIEGGYICCNDETNDERCIREQGAFCAGGCGLHAVCVNQTCQCMEGFGGDPHLKCTDINECEDDQMCPGVGSWCINMIGGHICCDADSNQAECKATKELKKATQRHEILVKEMHSSGGSSSKRSGGILIKKGDVDAEGINKKVLGESVGGCDAGCPEDSVCVDGTCECKAGFIGDPVSECQDINECNIMLDACADIEGGWCLNTIGSFHCCSPSSTVTDCIGLEIGPSENGTAHFRLTNSNASTVEEALAEIRRTQGGVVEESETEVLGQRNTSSGGQIVIAKGKIRNGEEDVTGKNEFGIEITQEGLNGTDRNEAVRKGTAIVTETPLIVGLSSTTGIPLPGRKMISHDGGQVVTVVPPRKTTRISELFPETRQPRINIEDGEKPDSELSDEEQKPTSGSTTPLPKETMAASSSTSSGNEVSSANESTDALEALKSTQGPTSNFTVSAEDKPTSAAAISAENNTFGASTSASTPSVAEFSNTTSSGTNSAEPSTSEPKTTVSGDIKFSSHSTESTTQVSTSSQDPDVVESSSTGGSITSPPPAMTTVAISETTTESVTSGESSSSVSGEGSTTSPSESSASTEPPTTTEPATASSGITSEVMTAFPVTESSTSFPSSLASSFMDPVATTREPAESKEAVRRKENGSVLPAGKKGLESSTDIPITVPQESSSEPFEPTSSFDFTTKLSEGDPTTGFEEKGVEIVEVSTSPPTTDVVSTESSSTTTTTSGETSMASEPGSSASSEQAETPLALAKSTPGVESTITSSASPSAASYAVSESTTNEAPATTDISSTFESTASSSAPPSETTIGNEESGSSIVATISLTQVPSTVTSTQTETSLSEFGVASTLIPDSATELTEESSGVEKITTPAPVESFPTSATSPEENESGSTTKKGANANSSTEARTTAAGTTPSGLDLSVSTQMSSTSVPATTAHTELSSAASSDSSSSTASSSVQTKEQPEASTASQNVEKTTFSAVSSSPVDSSIALSTTESARVTHPEEEGEESTVATPEGSGKEEETKTSTEASLETSKENMATVPTETGSTAKQSLEIVWEGERTISQPKTKETEAVRRKGTTEQAVSTSAVMETESGSTGSVTTQIPEVSRVGTTSAKSDGGETTVNTTEKPATETTLAVTKNAESSAVNFKETPAAASNIQSTFRAQSATTGASKLATEATTSTFAPDLTESTPETPNAKHTGSPFTSTTDHPSAEPLTSSSNVPDKSATPQKSTTSSEMQITTETPKIDETTVVYTSTFEPTTESASFTGVTTEESPSSKSQYGLEIVKVTAESTESTTAATEESTADSATPTRSAETESSSPSSVERISAVPELLTPIVTKAEITTKEKTAPEASVSSTLVTDTPSSISTDAETNGSTTLEPLGTLQKTDETSITTVELTTEETTTDSKASATSGYLIKAVTGSTALSTSSKTIFSSNASGQTESTSAETSELTSTTVVVTQESSTSVTDAPSTAKIGLDIVEATTAEPSAEPVSIAPDEATTIQSKTEQPTVESRITEMTPEGSGEGSTTVSFEGPSPVNETTEEVSTPGMGLEIVKVTFEETTINPEEVTSEATSRGTHPEEKSEGATTVPEIVQEATESTTVIPTSSSTESSTLSYTTVETAVTTGEAVAVSTHTNPTIPSTLVMKSTSEASSSASTQAPATTVTVTFSEPTFSSGEEPESTSAATFRPLIVPDDRESSESETSNEKQPPTLGPYIPPASTETTEVLKTTREVTVPLLTATISTEATKDTFSLRTTTERSTYIPHDPVPTFQRCITSNECGDDAYCERRSGVCRCPPGFRGSPLSGTCEDVNECQLKLDDCHPTARCFNYIGGYSCQCAVGYRKTVEGICEVINECNERNGTLCSSDATCSNLEGSYSCKCNPGYFGDGYVCVPLEKRQCTQEEWAQSDCGRNHVCMVDLHGKRDCDNCKVGFTTKHGVCSDINECESSEISRCHKDAICKNVMGGHVCQCQPGYQGDGYSCIDVDECTRNPCHPQATCINVPGSFLCRCPSSWGGDGREACVNPLDRACEKRAELCEGGAHSACLSVRLPPQGNLSSVCECLPNFRFNNVTKQCEDIDECLENRNNCDPATSQCVNSIGGFECECAPGYEGVGGICVDVDECQRGTSGCHINSICTNHVGSVGCQCAEGFTGDGVDCRPLQRVATDSTCSAEWENICRTLNKTCHVDDEEVSQCGSCLIGYQPMNGKCLPVNGLGNCADASKNNCDKNAECIDIHPGRHFCSCKIGYIGDGMRCDDVDECSIPSICDQEAACRNTNGSFECHCNKGFTGNGFKCVQNNNIYGGPSCHLNSFMCHSKAGCLLDGKCKCFNGYEGDGINSCEPISAAQPMALHCGPQNASSCHRNAYCDSSKNACVCRDGFYGDGVTFCQRSDLDCSKDFSICDPSAVCDFASKRCLCREGFIGDGLSCSPDELDCTNRPGLCSESAECSSSRCRCVPGFTGDGSTCVPIKDHAVKGCENCGMDAGCVEGVCRCLEGFFGNGIVCVPDPNDCRRFPKLCHENSLCDSKSGRCECMRGFLGNGLDCSEQKSCKTDPLICDSNANCIAEGKCQCRAGYYGNGIECHKAAQSVEPVVVHHGCTKESCGNHAECVNGVCRCIKGFALHGQKGCQDIDECASGAGRCHPLAKCTNTEGSYECHCQNGFIGDGKQCYQSYPVGNDFHILCIDDGIRLVFPNETFDGRVYVRGQNENPFCSKSFATVLPKSAQPSFHIPFHHCDFRMELNDTISTTVIIQRHPMFVTIAAESYDLRCNYPVVERTLLSHYNVSMIVPEKTIVERGPEPTCALTVENDEDMTVDAAVVGQTIKLALSVSPNKTYSILPKNCKAVNLETGEQYILTDGAGCAVDTELFPEWTRISPALVKAAFRTFKWPDSSMIRFQCDCSACIGECPTVNCGRRRLAMMRRRMRMRFTRGDVLDVGGIDARRPAFSTVLLVAEDEEERRAQRQMERWMSKGFVPLDERREEIWSEEVAERVCVDNRWIVFNAFTLLLCVAFTAALSVVYKRRKSFYDLKLRRPVDYASSTCDNSSSYLKF
ncbi:hypothetical protein L596_024483 [Steinernema carpocapsae]|uniref:Uncharacterized protein n=1 Tax=Steinernema carpocapsae TaxID=34508 RepID=A0A4U5MGU0_STECR|nr:hypothetical protein L596_024483 [Steinernema carpocapsae]